MVREDLHHNKATWRELYTDYGLKELAKVVMEEKIEAREREKKALYVKDAKWSAHVIQHILLSTDRVLLESLLFGNLAKDRLQNTYLNALLVELRAQSEFEPGIYYQSLVNSAGESPTTRQPMKVCDVMIGYVAGCGKPEATGLGGTVDHVLANKIDNLRASMKNPVPMSQSTASYRKYLNTKTQVALDANNNPITQPLARGKKSVIPVKMKIIERYRKSHVKEIVHFVKMLRKRLASVALTDHYKPLQFPIIEIGYAKRCVERLEDHARHSSSNYIMNLAEAICAALERLFQDRCRTHQFVTYLVWLPEQAEISENGFAKLAEGYIHNAGGFSHYPAGLSNHSANKILAREWNGAKKYLHERSVYPDNIRARRDAYEKKVVAVEKKVEMLMEKRQKQESHKMKHLEQRLESASITKDKGIMKTKLQMSKTLNSLYEAADHNTAALRGAVKTLRSVHEGCREMREGAHARLHIINCLDKPHSSERDTASTKDWISYQSTATAPVGRIIPPLH